MAAPLFRADQVGSLLRPASLLELRSTRNIITSYDSVAADPDVEQATRRGVAAVVAKQLDLSI